MNKKVTLNDIMAWATEIPYAAPHPQEPLWVSQDGGINAC
jgi:hypothetical protein